MGGRTLPPVGRSSAVSGTAPAGPRAGTAEGLVRRRPARQPPVGRRAHTPRDVGATDRAGLRRRGRVPVSWTRIAPATTPARPVSGGPGPRSPGAGGGRRHTARLDREVHGISDCVRERPKPANGNGFRPDSEARQVPSRRHLDLTRRSGRAAPRPGVSPTAAPARTTGAPYPTASRHGAAVAPDSTAVGERARAPRPPPVSPTGPAAEGRDRRPGAERPAGRGRSGERAGREPIPGRTAALEPPSPPPVAVRPPVPRGERATDAARCRPSGRGGDGPGPVGWRVSGAAHRAGCGVRGPRAPGGTITPLVTGVTTFIVLSYDMADHRRADQPRRRSPPTGMPPAEIGRPSSCRPRHLRGSPAECTLATVTPAAADLI